METSESKALGKPLQYLINEGSNNFIIIIFVLLIVNYHRQLFVWKEQFHFIYFN